jgi:hypothetical protein
VKDADGTEKKFLTLGILVLECAILEMLRASTTNGRPAMTGSTLLLFLLGTLIGVLMGGALCVRYLRHEIAADICPRLRRLQLQLDNLESAINLVLVTRYAEIGNQLPREPAYRLPDQGGEPL